MRNTHKNYLIIGLLIFLDALALGQKSDSLLVKRPGITYEQNDSVKVIHVDEEKQLGILLSYQLGKYSYGELGFAALLHSRYGFHPVSSVAFVSSEFKMGDKFIMGPKAGFWIGGGLALGLNAIYYTDFDEGAFVLRPEIGFGLYGFKLVYGYNWNLTNKDFRGINTHFAGITYAIPVKKTKTTREINIGSSKK